MSEKPPCEVVSMGPLRDHGTGLEGFKVLHVIPGVVDEHSVRLEGADPVQVVDLGFET